MLRELCAEQVLIRNIVNEGCPDAFSKLLPFMTSNLLRVRWALMWGFGKIGDARATEPMVDILRTWCQLRLREENNSFLEPPTEAFRDIGDARAVDLLIPLTSEADELTRIYALDALGAVGSPAAIPVLAAALEGRGFFAQNAPARALGQIRHPDALQVLLAQLEKSPSSAVVEALGRLGYPEAALPLAQSLKRGAHSRKVSEALGRLGWPDVQTVLCELLTHRDASVRENAAGVLGDLKAHDAGEPLYKLEDKRELKALLRALERSEDSFSRVAAAEALLRAKEIVDPRVFQATLAVLHKTDAKGWEYAPTSALAVLLGRTGNPNAFEPLWVLVQDSSRCLPGRDGLLALLECGAADVRPENLECILALDDWLLYSYSWFTSDYSEAEEIKEVDCRRLKQRAREELQRRRCTGGSAIHEA